MNVLFLITARGGSKGVPRKNLRRIAGIPLIGYKAISARQSRYCKRLIISTEDPEIQTEARRLGIEVPFTRPMELATDDAATVDVIAHAMGWIEQCERRAYDAVMLLEPTSPFARGADYDAAVRLLCERNANVVVGIREMEVSSDVVGSLDEQGRIAAIVNKIGGRHEVRRQDFKKEYTMNGALYLFRWDFFKMHRRIYEDPDTSYGYVMDRLHSIEIDEPIDLAWAEFLVEQGLLDITEWRNPRA